MDLLWMLGYRARGYRKRRAQVEAAIADGDVPAAIELLHQQERAWKGNWQNGSRKSVLVDLDHLLWILTKLAVLSPNPAIHHALSAAQKHRDLIADRTNFGIDGRMMKREAAILVGKFYDENSAAREAMRTALKPGT